MSVIGRLFRDFAMTIYNFLKLFSTFIVESFKYPSKTTQIVIKKNGNGSIDIKANVEQ